MKAQKKTKQNLLLYLKKRRVLYANEAVTLLGSRCSECNRSAFTGNELRICFKDQFSPLKAKYKTSPVTLHQKICTKPEVRKQLEFTCRECLIMGGAPLGN